jgi:NAD(P)-dependent dehydrogenase (short-subunit alcohol dehydrogenase family)
MASDPTLANRHVVITGGRGGLGGVLVDTFVAAGAIVHLPERSSREAAPAGVHVVSGVDLTDEGAVKSFYAGLPPLWASIHLAGGYAGAPFLDTSLADFRAQLDINLTTAFLCCREALRALRVGSAGKGGRIVNVTSRAALAPAGGSIAYSAAKAAVSTLTQCLADEAKPDGILVNAVAPSIIDTPANRAAMPKAAHDRWPKPAEIAEAILWLASPRNTLTSGAIVPVFGAA